MAAAQPAAFEAFSGSLNKSQLQAIRRTSATVMGLIAVNALVAVFAVPAFIHLTRSGMLVLVAAVAALAVFAMWIQYRSDMLTVVEFNCLAESLTFRTLHKSEPVTKPVWEIKTIGYWVGRKGPSGYDLTFRDGTEIFVPSGSQPFDRLVDRLRPYCQTLVDYAELTVRA